MKKQNRVATAMAILAAVLYALSTPFCKLILSQTGETFTASFLYLGAGIGIGIMDRLRPEKPKNEKRLAKEDLLYVAGMIVLDIAAPIFLMMGLKIGNASNIALLNNFEIVATALIALALFKEKISKQLALAIGFIIVSSILLSLNETDSFNFSLGSIFALLATLCWGMENNCTRNISDKSTCQIVTLKGIFSGLGSFFIALFKQEMLPSLVQIGTIMLLGFISYGLSIFVYIRAQKELGAAKTSAYYAVAPFISTFLCFILLKEELNKWYWIALTLMIVGTVFVIKDSLQNEQIKKQEEKQ